jgi:hypothetical protein
MEVFMRYLKYSGNGLESLSNERYMSEDLNVYEVERFASFVYRRSFALQNFPFGFSFPSGLGLSVPLSVPGTERLTFSEP